MSQYALKEVKEATRVVEILSKAISVESDFNKETAEYDYIPSERRYTGQVELTFIHERQLQIAKNLTPKARRLTAGGSQ